MSGSQIYPRVSSAVILRMPSSTALQRITLNLEPCGSGSAPRTFELKWPRGPSLQRRAQALQVRNIGDNNKDVLHTIAVFSSEIKWLGLLPYFK